MNVTAYTLAQRFVGIKEFAGAVDNPFIMSMLQLDTNWPQHDEVSWCSGFCNYVCWLLRLPRSKSLAARSWLHVGRPVGLHEATAGFDVAILSRGDNPDSGHVGFYASWQAGRIWLLGGNQDNSVSVKDFNAARVIGVRRLLG